MSDAPPVHCAHAEMVVPDRLVDHPRNPNRHGDLQLELLEKIIRHQGWRSPVTVSRLSGFVVAGHARVEVARRIGCMVPVDYQDFATDADEVAHLIADNRIAELATIDLPVLKDALIEIDTGAIDMDLTGFTQTAIEKMMVVPFPLPVSEAPKCPRCGYTLL